MYTKRKQMKVERWLENERTLYNCKGVKKNWNVMMDYLSKRSLIIAIVLTVGIFVGSVGVALWGH